MCLLDSTIRAMSVTLSWVSNNEEECMKATEQCRMGWSIYQKKCQMKWNVPYNTETVDYNLWSGLLISRPECNWTPLASPQTRVQCRWVLGLFGLNTETNRENKAAHNGVQQRWYENTRCDERHSSTVRCDHYWSKATEYNKDNKSDEWVAILKV